MSLVRLLQKRGDLVEARDLLGPLFASFGEGFDTADLIESKALLDNLNQ